MKERKFSEVKNKWIRCKEHFPSLIFPKISYFLRTEILSGNGLNISNNLAKSTILRNSLLEIKDKTLEASINTSSVSKKDIYSKTTNVSDEKTLSALIELIKNFYKIIKKQKIIIKINSTDKDMTDEFKDLLEYIIDVLKLEEQQLIKKESIHDSTIGTELKGSYQFDAKLRKQIDNIFDANSTWKPESKDIKQGQLADCSLLSALLSIIKTDPNAIRKCFFGQTKNTIKFRFFKVKIDIKPPKGSKPSGYKASPNGKIIIEVRKSILKDFENKIIGNSTDALWVNMFEKAFTVYKATDEYVTSTDFYCQTNIIDKWKNTTSGSISISNLEWGYGFIFLTAITGKCAVSRNTPPIKGKKFPDLKNPSDPNERNYDKSAEDLYNFFDKTLKANKAIVVCSRDDKFESWFKKFPDKTRDYSSPKNHPGLVKMHSYAMVDSVMEDGEHYKYVILQNPHMENPAGYRVNKSFKIKKVKLSSSKSGIQRQENPKYQNLSNGQLKIELNDFIKYFVSYDICSKTKDKT